MKIAYDFVSGDEGVSMTSLLKPGLFETIIASEAASEKGIVNK